MAVLLLVIAGGARAQDRQPEGQERKPDRRDQVAVARLHFERGQRLFTVSRYREALDEFKEGFLAKDDPVFLYNIAQCHRLLGEREEAILYYRRYLRAAPDSRNASEVQRRIRELEAAPADRRAPLPPPVAPPPHVASALPPPAPLTTSRAPEAAVVAPAPARDPAPEAGGLFRRWWFWGLVGTAVAAGAAGVFVATRAKEPACPAPCSLQ